MKLTKKEFDLLNKDALIQYITDFVAEQVKILDKKQLSNESFDKPNWQCYQANALGQKKALLKILEKITYND